ncbi:hypothetical protein [Streptomyces sp. NPDC020917]|uniref:hypothetical protein n=1 Tax=Streptomyces sp. NPDC020917 TaxID=3365102 RepID=UPI0037892ADF
MLLEPENTLFVRGTLPALLLAGAPIHDALPQLAVAEGPIPACEGWTLIPQLTMCVVDGPGEHGLLVAAFVAPVADGPDARTAPQPGAAGMSGWCEDAERAGGAVVLSLAHLPATPDWPALLPTGSPRGGFVPTPT